MRHIFKILGWLLLVIGLGFGMAQPVHFRILGIDSSKANIPVTDILSGGPPPQGIPGLGFTGDWRGAAPPTKTPSFVSQEDAAQWLAADEPVILFELAGEAKIYPLQILTWHEIANDVVGGVPVVVTFCPLCNSALAFDRRIPLTSETQDLVTNLNPRAQPQPLDDTYLQAYDEMTGEASSVVSGLEVTFGVSGLLFNSNLIMFDTETSTLWLQLLGQGNVGTLTDTSLLRYPAQIVSFQEARDAFPEAKVLSRDTGFPHAYGRNPYVGYDSVGQPPFLFRSGNGQFKDIDGRLPAQERVVSVSLRGEDVAYPFSVLSQVRTINDEVAGETVAVFWSEGTTSALDGVSIADSKDIGSVGIFSSEVDGNTLTFTWTGEAFQDDQTGSTWNILGQAVSGELAGTQLAPIIHDNTLWFAWAAFKPETRVYLPN